MATPFVEFRVAVTDRQWLQYFRDHPDVTEMNFWRPGTPVTKVEPGTMWVFLLKPNSVAGYAVVEVSSHLPLSVAWDAFGTANGFDQRESFFARISQYRHGQTTSDSEIGCVGLMSPVFFRQPFDFAPFQATWTNRTQPTRRYSTATPEGAALWRELQQRAPLASEVSLMQSPENSQIARRLITVRLGQGGFRTCVIQAYDRRCAITGERSLPALEAAHIKPFSEVRRHEARNGILLRADIHKLFDSGYVSVDPHLKFHVSPVLREQYSNGRIYYELDGRELRVPAAQPERPDPAYLDWHYNEVFRRG